MRLIVFHKHRLRTNVSFLKNTYWVILISLFLFSHNNITGSHERIRIVYLKYNEAIIETFDVRQ